MPAEFLYNLTKKTVGASSAQALCGVALTYQQCNNQSDTSCGQNKAVIFADFQWEFCKEIKQHIRIIRINVYYLTIAHSDRFINEAFLTP